MARLFRSGLRSKWERSYARAAHGRKRFERETTNDESRAASGERRAAGDGRRATHVPTVCAHPPARPARDQRAAAPPVATRARSAPVRR
ncbi:uncha [Burkholderia pseudomallei 305]|nr:uncha [Burkholderia pseudomallei 305]